MHVALARGTREHWHRTQHAARSTQHDSHALNSSACELARLALLLTSQTRSGNRRRRTNVILITLDGARTQEIFGGLDLDVLRAGLKKDEQLERRRAYKRYWAATPEARRARVMPFFWTEWMPTHGSIAGNRARGSRFGITNRHRFSYPGYAEILTGEPHDAVIDSNDNRRYPFPTLLDVLKRRLSLSREQVAAFGSWETFNWIASRDEDSFVVNAGYEAFASGDAGRAAAEPRAVRDPDRLGQRAPRHVHVPAGAGAPARARGRACSTWRSARPTTGRTASATTASCRRSSAPTPGSRSCGPGCRADPQYRDNTAILITVDHGRGRTRDRTGASTATTSTAPQETWLAAIGPDWPRRGEWTNAPDAFSNQVAATLARKPSASTLARRHPGAGAPIDYLWER